jgi:hypothetical protein
MDCDADALLHLSDQIPIDLIVDEPTAEFSPLYRFAELIRKHPVRVTVKAVPRMTRAVKIAQALNFSVRLEIDQPEAAVVDELLALAEYYLRGSSVSSPVEPFHSLFLSFLSGKPTNLWSLQEEDPSVDRYVADAGNVVLSRRLISLGIPEDQLEGALEKHVSACREAGECATCEWFSRCQGYLKLPDNSYRCEHVKRLFALLNYAAAEMRKDEERFVELHGTAKSDSDSSPAPLPKGASPCAPTIGGEEQEELSSFAMKRLSHRLEEFTRHFWANDEAKTVWGPRISKVCACIAELEWRSILEGIRACALTSIAPNELEDFGSMLSNHGLTVVPIEKIAATDSYISSGRPFREGEPFSHRCAIGRKADAELLKSAHLSRNDEAV